MSNLNEKLLASADGAEESGFHEPAELMREAVVQITKLEKKLDHADRLVLRLEGKIESLEDALDACRVNRGSQIC